MALKRNVYVRVFMGEHQYTAECLDLPVVTQGTTLDEVARNIQEAVSLHLEGEDLAALGFQPNPGIVITLELEAVA
jgi:predicted RNase H-like HicB family nuclease